MEKMPRTDSPTVHAHKRQFIWQILVPFLLMAGLVIAAAVVVAFFGGASRSRVWADVSTIWILAPMLVLALLVAAVLGLVIYGMARLIPLIPRYTGRLQQIASIVSAGTQNAADGVAKPFVWFQQAGAAIKSFIQKI